MSSPFQFGTPSTSGGSNTPAFGTAGASPFSQNASGNTSGLFGNIGATPTTTGASSTPLFGGSTTPASGQTTSLFGGQSSKPTFGGGSGTPSTSFFAKPSDQGQSGGQSGGQTPTAGIFGGASQTPKLAEPASSGQTQSGLFGALAKTTPFGNATPAQSGAAPLFGNMSTTPAGPPPQTSAGQGLFTNQASTKPGESASLFGQKPGTSAPFAGLGATTSALSPASTPTTTAATPGFFTNATQSQTPGASNLFASPATKGQGAEAGKPDAKPTPFGAAGTSTTPQTSSSLFNTPGTSGAQLPQKPLSFPSAKPASSAFTSATMSETSQKPPFGSLGGSSASTSAPSASTTTTAAPAGAMFTGLGTPKTSAPKDSTTAASSSGQPAGGMFNLNKPTNTTAPATSSPATTSTAGGAATTAAPTTGATTGAGATTSTAATAGGLGASTVGPAPPAQSRLKNKTMDEIITRWATDLTKYQKEFQEQAEQVATWDRMLVENGTKVQKLYGNTVDAERATQEVERQLASVEGQQDELSSWLDRYEQEVEALLSKQVGITDSLQGPDQERERTYKLAERLSERLNEMGQDLTSMIEEVNSASSTMSKTTKADEPISQIVRILNSHLSQLQLIDQGTANLYAKIAASQKLGGSLSAHQHQGPYSQYRNGTGNGMGGGGAADDFYKAYMGRR
ncbi:nuclear pore complex protein Nup62 [[Emmonsia] crescens]|uniref:Nucleoporin NSP1 n=1 Tax=[Emmonsia] crescens TaxID=73230 RepID=A0A2B7ZKZ4_9EURO|nr:nuclear pore complex protein Nup62 [Emmonsia crescens]